MIITARFAFERETKGALRYVEVGDDGKRLDWGFKVGALYIRKEATKGESPQFVDMQLTIADVAPAKRKTVVAA